MYLIVTVSTFLVMTALLGMCAWRLEMRWRDERLMEETLGTAELLDKSLDERLHEIDAYRHDLAALVQELVLEQVREAEEKQSGERDPRARGAAVPE